MKEKELKLEIEELEERIAPAWVVDPNLAPGMGTDTTGGPTETSIGPDPGGFPTRTGGIAMSDDNGESFQGPWHTRDTDVLNP